MEGEKKGSGEGQERGSEADPVFGTNGTDRLLVEIRQLHSGRHADAAFLLLPHDDLGRFLVQADPKPLKFILEENVGIRKQEKIIQKENLNNALVRQRLKGIKDDQNQCASPSDSNNLATTTLSETSTFNNSRKIQQLV
jgi:hypothetical protein